MSLTKTLTFLAPSASARGFQLLELAQINSPAQYRWGDGFDSVDDDMGVAVQPKDFSEGGLTLFYFLVY
jgi:hypothetical protein